MLILIDDDKYSSELVRLNEGWIRRHFSPLEVEARLAEDPAGILRSGGHILTGVDEERVVGVVALLRSSHDEFELARLAVDPSYQRRGIGRALATAALAAAEDTGAKRVFLYSDSSLAAALGLYRSLGFLDVARVPHPDYGRCNLMMEKRFFGA